MGFLNAITATASEDWLNGCQRAILRAYSDGEFAHLIDCANAPTFETALNESGDTLLRFLIIETSRSEGCTDVTKALHRLARARDDVTHAN